MKPCLRANEPSRPRALRTRHRRTTGRTAMLTTLCALLLGSLILPVPAAFGQGNPPSSREEIRQQIRERLAAGGVVAAGIDAHLSKTVTLAAGESGSLFDLYRRVGEAAGLTVLFDPDLRDQETTIDLGKTTAGTALDRLTRAAGHFYTALDAGSLIIAADTPAHRRQYDRLVVRTFYLENTHVKDMMTLLRSLVDAKKLAVLEDLNAVTIRDTPARVALAEHLVERWEKPQAEVTVDLELLAVDRRALEDLAGTAEGSATPPLRLGSSQLHQLRQSAGARVLATPRLNTLGGDWAKLTIGEMHAFPTADEKAGDAAPGLSYQEVGLAFRVRPRVHGEAREVSLDFELDLSGIADESPRRPVVARRNLSSQIRLGEGQSFLLSGLLHLRDDSPRALPLLEAPLAGGKELVLAVTPRIVRWPVITDTDVQSLPAGTEAQLGAPEIAFR